jgi:hypothetical protein
VQAPGLAAGITPWSLDFNTAGSAQFDGLPGGALHAATLARIQGPGVTNNTDTVLYAGPVGAPLVPVARTGGTAPGAGGSTYSTINRPGLGGNGTVAYIASFEGPPGSPFGTAVFHGTPANPQMLLRDGSPAPGLPAGVNIAFGDTSLTNQQLRLNDIGGILFATRLAGTGVVFGSTDRAVFAGPDDDLRLIMRAGDDAPVPGQSGVRYVFSQEFEINDNDQVVFYAGLGGAGVTSANDFALFFDDPLLGATMIVREGDLFDVGGGDLRTIADGGIRFSTPVSGDDPVQALTDDGRVAFALRFTDGSTGAFVAAVPEPASAVLAAAALLAASPRRRARRACRPAAR